MRVAITTDATLFLNAETPADENRILRLIGRDYQSRLVEPRGESLEVMFEQKESEPPKEPQPPMSQEALDPEGIDVAKAAASLARSIEKMKACRRPKTCRECVFCSKPEPGGHSGWSGLVSDCCYSQDEYRRVCSDHPACHLGELRDESLPWVTVGDDRVHTPTPKRQTEGENNGS